MARCARFATLWIGVELVATLAGCQRAQHAARPSDDAGRPPACTPERHESPGLIVEKTTSCMTVVHADPARFAPRLLSANERGGSRTASVWARDFALTSVINASMFAPDRRSIGLLASGDLVNNGHDNPKLGAFLAFDPADPGDPPLVFASRDCQGFDLAALRKKYRSIVQNYRLLDCNGQPLPWKDGTLHSAAAIGLDARGWLTFVHSRRATQVTEFARALSSPELALRGAMYVEGGPEASLYVKTGDLELAEEAGVIFPIPNVLGVAPRPSPETR